MNATARSTIRAVAFALEEYVPRRRSTSELAHPFGANTRKKSELGIGHQGVGAGEALVTALEKRWALQCTVNASASPALLQRSSSAFSQRLRLLHSPHASHHSLSCVRGTS